jgi:hypothetical protein
MHSYPSFVFIFFLHISCENFHHYLLVLEQIQTMMACKSNPIDVQLIISIFLISMSNIIDNIKIYNIKISLIQHKYKGGYVCHISINFTFCSTNECAMS